MVGHQQLQVEPTKELSAREHFSPQLSPVNMDTTFCDSLLNPIPNTMSPQTDESSNTDTESSVCDFLDDMFSDLDVLSLDLDSFLPTSVSLNC